MRAVVVNMRDRFVDAVDHFRGDDRILVFGVPVFVGGRLHSGIRALHGIVAAHLATGIDQHLDQRLESSRRTGTIDQQGFGGAADPGPPHLGVQHDRFRHFQIGGVIDIDVIDAFQMREHRHPCFGFDARDEAFAAARHDHIDAAVQSAQQQAHRGAVTGRHQRDGSLRQIGLAQSLHQAAVDRPAGPETVRAAAQDHRIAGFQAQHAGIGGDIGAAFENHGDNAERHAHALDGHAVRTLPALGHDADGIWDIAHRPDAVRHRLDSRRRQCQPIDEGGTGAAATRFRDILGIISEDRRCMGADGALHRFERAIFLPGRCQRQHPRGGARADR